MNCLLCNSSRLKISEEYATEDLVKLWKPYYEIETIIKDKQLKFYTCTDCQLQFFNPEYAGDDKFYSVLGKEDWYYNHPGKSEYDFVQDYFKDGMKVLDIGCGQAVLLSKTKAKIDYTGIELSSWAVSFGQENGINILNETIQEHAIQHEEKYDVIVSFQVLEHLTEVRTFLNSVLKALKKGGMFIVAMPNNESFISRLPNYTFNLPPHHTILWNKKQLEFIPEIFDFELIKFSKERIHEVHIDSAKFSTKYWLFSILRSEKVKLIDLSSNYYSKVDKIKRMKGSKMDRLIEFLFKNKNSDGQSMIAVYRKK
jgi:2-polyprenyl-3-methyl-5-hydroxy-6-metoxy-1,4-benzoquinol methylase